MLTAPKAARQSGVKRASLFVPHSAMASGSKPAIDIVVEFTIETDPNSGRLRASSVRPI